VLTHALRQVSVSLILDVRQNEMSRELPPPSRKHPLPSHLGYPVNFTTLEVALRPHLPDIEFSLHFAGADSRLITNRDFDRYRVFTMWFTPAHHRAAYWSFYCYGILREDKKDFLEQVLAGPLEWICRFPSEPRTPVDQNFRLFRCIDWIANEKRVLCHESKERGN
jgi:hypothetical protein